MLFRYMVFLCFSLLPFWGWSATGYVANIGNDALSVFDTETNTVVGVISLGAPVHGVCVSQEFVYGATDGTVHVIDAQTNQVLRTISVEGSPYFMALYEDNLFVLSNSSDCVTVIDAHTNQVKAVIQSSSFNGLQAMAFRGNFAYVAQNSGVVVLDVKKYIVVDTITVGTNPQGIAIRGAYAYVADSGVSDLYVIDTNTNTLVTTIALPNFATDVHIVKDLAYVTEVDASLVSVIDLETNQVVDEIVLSLIDNSVGYGYLYGNSLYVLTNSTVQILNVDTGAVSQVADPFATVYIPLMVAVAPFVYDMNQFNLVNQAGIADAENILTQSGLSGTNNH